MANRNLSVEWTKHLKDKSAKEDFEKLLRNSTISLGRLREILEEKLTALDRSEVKSDVYDSPNWAYKQADVNGMRRVLMNIIALLDFTRKGT